MPLISLKHLNVKFNGLLYFISKNRCMSFNRCFQKFSNFAYETYGLDLRYSYTIPGFSWQAMLKMTKIELDLISDQDMYFFNGFNTRWYLSS